MLNFEPLRALQRIIGKLEAHITEITLCLMSGDILVADRRLFEL